MIQSALTMFGVALGCAFLALTLGDNRFWFCAAVVGAGASVYAAGGAVYWLIRKNSGHNEGEGK